MSEIKRDDDNQPLIDAISKIVYEMRALEDMANLIRSDIRNHDDKTQKFYSQNERISLEIQENNKSLIKLDRDLNEIITKQNLLQIELDSIIKKLSKVPDDSGSDDWLKKQLEAYQTAQTATVEQNRKDNNALLMKILIALIGLAVFIAGATGKI
jgi:predicted transcriptional regulator